MTHFLRAWRPGRGEGSGFSPRGGGPAPVLYVHHGQNWIRGSERCLLQLVEHLDRSRFRPVVLTDSEALATSAAELGATVHRRLDLAGPDQFLPPWSLVRDARSIVRADGIRLIHANSLETVKWLLPVARGGAIPMLAHIHSPSTESERCYGGLHQVRLVVGASAAAIAGFIEDGMPIERLRVVYNGVDPDRLEAGDATALRAQLGIDAEEIVSTVVGSLIDRKGHDVVLSAMGELQRSPRRHRLLIVGSGPERPALEARARELGIDKTVHFLGERRDVGAILRDATDIAVSAARAEAFPLNVLEAAFCGRPVVASAIAPHAEAVIDGETGLLVPENDTLALVRAVERLAGDAELRRRYGEAAARRVREHFLVTRYVALFDSLYCELLGGLRWRWGWWTGWIWPSVYTRWTARMMKRRMAAFGGPRWVPAEHSKQSR
jgi:glycosyltransferase involved in cell wall biosynthesis